MSKASVGMELLNGSDLIKAIEKLDAMVRIKVTDKAVRAGAAPIRKQMRANAPDSRRTGSLERQSQGTRSKWKNAARLKNVIRAVNRKTPSGTIALVGPSYSDGGGHGNLFSRDHKRTVLWGRDTGSTRTVNQFVKATADQTRSAAMSAMMQVIKREIDNAAKQVGRA